MPSILLLTQRDSGGSDAIHFMAVLGHCVVIWLRLADSPLVYNVNGLESPHRMLHNILNDLTNAGHA